MLRVIFVEINRISQVHTRTLARHTVSRQPGTRPIDRGLRF